jgi:hypothetical protein
MSHPDALSIDRIDSKKGYVEGNVCLCGKEINLFKKAYPVDKFVNWCRLIAKNCIFQV